MPPLESVAAFAVAAAVLVAIPGPSVLFVIGRSLVHGRRGGVLSVLGNELGALVLAVVVALGLGSVVAESLALFTAVRLLGAAYLVHLGLLAVRHRKQALQLEDAGTAARRSSATLLREGFVVGVTNPKTIVFFIAVLPQFVDFSAGAVGPQMVVLGFVFTLVAFIGDSIWALAAGSAGAWVADSPQRLSVLRATGGSLMIALGATLALGGHRL